MGLSQRAKYRQVSNTVSSSRIDDQRSFSLENLPSAQKKSKSCPFSLRPPPPPRSTIIVWIHQRRKVRSFCPAPETISVPFLCIQFQSGRDPYGRNSSLLGDCKLNQNLPLPPRPLPIGLDEARQKQRKKEEKKRLYLASITDSWHSQSDSNLFKLSPTSGEGREKKGKNSGGADCGDPKAPNHRAGIVDGGERSARYDGGCGLM